MTGDQLREESGDRRDPFHIADKDKEADECQEQKVVDPDKQRAVLYENSGQDDEKHDRPGIVILCHIELSAVSSELTGLPMALPLGELARQRLRGQGC